MTIRIYPIAIIVMLFILALVGCDRGEVTVGNGNQSTEIPQSTDAAIPNPIIKTPIIPSYTQTSIPISGPTETDVDKPTLDKQTSQVLDLLMSDMPQSEKNEILEIINGLWEQGVTTSIKESSDGEWNVIFNFEDKQLGTLDLENNSISLITAKNEPYSASLFDISVAEGKIEVAVDEETDDVLRFEEGEWLSDRLLFLALGPEYSIYRTNRMEINPEELWTGSPGEIFTRYGLGRVAIAAVILEILGPDPNFPDTAIRVQVGFYDIGGELHPYEMMLGTNPIEPITWTYPSICIADANGNHCRRYPIDEAEDILRDFLNRAGLLNILIHGLIEDYRGEPYVELSKLINRYKDTHIRLIDALVKGDDFPEPPRSYFIPALQIGLGSFRYQN